MFRYKIAIPVTLDALSDKSWDPFSYALIVDYAFQTRSFSSYTADDDDEESFENEYWVVPTRKASYLLTKHLGKGQKAAASTIKAISENEKATNRLAANIKVSDSDEPQLMIRKKMTQRFTKVNSHTLNLFLTDEELDSFDFRVYLRLKSWYEYSIDKFSEPYQFRIGGTGKKTLLETIGYCPTSNINREKAKKSIEKLSERGLVTIKTTPCSWDNCNTTYKVNLILHVGNYSEDEEIEGDKTWCLLSKSQMRTLERSEE